MCKPLLPEQPPLRDHLDKMIEAAEAEHSRWKMAAWEGEVWEIKKDGEIVVRFKQTDLSHLRYQKFYELRERAKMEAAYKAAQDWFCESVNRGNPVPDDVLWPRFGVASVPANMVWGDGSAIHHKDGDIQNNDLTNLMPLPYAAMMNYIGQISKTVGDGIALMSVSHPEPCGLFPEEEESERDRIARVTREMCGG